MVKRAESASGGEISVQVAVLGAPIQTVLLAEGATVTDALAAAGIDTSSVCRCNGEEVSGEDVVENNDRLIITSKVKGGTL